MYFWSLIVAVLIFGLGGGVSFYEGFQHIQQPEPIRDPTWNYVVLAAAALFEGTSFGIALNQFKKEVGARPFWRALHASKDPTTYTVLAEDFAALLGLAIAARHLPEPSAGDTGTRRRRLGRDRAAAGGGRGAADPRVARPADRRRCAAGDRRAIRATAREQPGVHAVGRILSMYLGPNDVLAVIDLDFEDGTSTENAAAAIAAIEARVRARYPMIKRLFIEAGASAPGGSASAVP